MIGKSNRLILGLIIISSILMGTSLFTIYLKRNIGRDARVIGNAAILRGSVQRLVKLEDANIQANSIVSQIDRLVSELSAETGMQSKAGRKLDIQIDKISYSWNLLKKSIVSYRKDHSKQKKELLISQSEMIWNETNEAVVNAQFILQKREEYFKLLFFLLCANIVFLGMSIYVIKRYVKDKLEHIVIRDPLTGVYNRRYFYEYLSNAFEIASRHKNPLALVMFDIDYFKRINDNYGHDIGDYVLQKISALIKAEIGSKDILVRFGGEEFIVVTVNVGMKDAEMIAEKLRRVVAAFSFETVGNITVSFGVTEFRPGDSIEELVKRADIALYKAKQSGRNMVKTE